MAGGDDGGWGDGGWGDGVGAQLKGDQRLSVGFSCSSGYRGSKLVLLGCTRSVLFVPTGNNKHLDFWAARRGVSTWSPDWCPCSGAAKCRRCRRGAVCPVSPPTHCKRCFSTGVRSALVNAEGTIPSCLKRKVSSLACLIAKLSYKCHIYMSHLGCQNSLIFSMFPCFNSCKSTFANLITGGGH